MKSKEKTKNEQVSRMQNQGVTDSESERDVRKWLIRVKSRAKTKNEQGSRGLKQLVN